MRSSHLGSGALGLLLLLCPALASGADVLLVSDASSDTNIADALRGDGHTVTLVTGDFSAGSNPTLAGLSPGEYDAVVWVANGSGPGDSHTNAATFTALNAYVDSGGRVFVTGYDSIASPADPNLIDFIGGLSSSDGASVPGPVVSEENSLTIGIVDIRGVTPSGYASDRDTVIGLQPGTVGIVSSSANWQWTLRERGAGEIAYVSNGGSSGNHASWTTTTAGGAGAYNAAVRNFVSGAAVGAPRIRWVEGQSLELPEGGELLIAVSVEDREGDAVTVSWDLDGDGEYDDGSGESATFSAVGMDGPDVARISVLACDTPGNCSHRDANLAIRNAPPQLAGEPVTHILIGEEWTYTPEVWDPGGDAVTFQVVGRPPGSVLLAGGGLRWTPTDTDVGDHVIAIHAVDDDDDPTIEGDGDATLEFTLTVSENLPPGPPRALSPERGAELAELRPTLVVENPSDPEGDALRIAFEVSTSDTFADPIASGLIAAGTDGTTSWTLTQSLTDGRRYHWRAWAHDGRAEGPRVSSFFFVDMRGDAGPGDGGADGGADAGADSGLDHLVEPGCACRTSGSGGAGAGLALLLLAALAFVGRRRG